MANYKSKDGALDQPDPYIQHKNFSIESIKWMEFSREKKKGKHCLGQIWAKFNYFMIFKFLIKITSRQDEHVAVDRGHPPGLWLDFVSTCIVSCGQFNFLSWSFRVTAI